MSIQIIHAQSEWKQKNPEFLQSWEWGEFQRRVGYEPLRIQHGQDYLQGFVHRLPLGLTFVYFPRVDISLWTKELEHYLAKKGFLFARLEPLQHLEDGVGVSIRPRQPHHTLMLSLLHDEDDLLQAMHAKTRYNIRLAEKKGVTISTEKNVDIFWQLNEETTSRDDFKTQGKDYYKEMLDLPFVRQKIAWYDGRAIASHIYIAYGDRYTYLHGTSSNHSRNVMAPYLLQWQSIREAKAEGYTLYDFWGVAAPLEHGVSFHTHSWDEADKLSSVTRYKAGFGGEVLSYPGGVEIALRQGAYMVFRLIKKVV